MDYLRLVLRLRPGVTWLNNTVNPYSLETIQDSYQSADPFPTPQQFAAENIIMLAEDAERAQEEEDIDQAVIDSGLPDLTIAQAHAWLDAQYASITSLAEAKTVLKEIDKKFAAIIIRVAKRLK